MGTFIFIFYSLHHNKFNVHNNLHCFGENKYVILKKLKMWYTIDEGLGPTVPISVFLALCPKVSTPHMLGQVVSLTREPRCSVLKIAW